jgi:membrane protein YqaA with SNARE-associated domain
MLPKAPDSIHDARQQMTEQLFESLGLYGGTLVVCFVSGLLPIVNTELFLVALGGFAVTSLPQLVAVSVLAAIGQMTAHVAYYYAGQGVAALPRGKAREKIERARVRLERWKKRPYAILALASTVGIPPLLIVSALAGALKISFRAYCLVGLVGRTLRFAVILAIPWLVA